MNDNTLKINALNSKGFDPRMVTHLDAEIEDYQILEKGCYGFDIFFTKQNKNTKI